MSLEVLRQISKMGPRNARDDGKHSIRMPGVIIDEIKANELKGRYADDDFHYQTSKKQKTHKLSRKEKRKEERKSKKQKRSHKGTSSINKEFSSLKGSKSYVKDRTESSDEVDEDVEEKMNDANVVWKRLQEMKQKKTQHATATGKAARQRKDGESSSSNVSEDENSVDPIAALKALKGNRPQREKADNVRIVNLEDLESDDLGLDDLLTEDEDEHSSPSQDETEDGTHLDSFEEFSISDNDDGLDDSSSSNESSELGRNKKGDIGKVENPNRKIQSNSWNVSQRQLELMKRDEEEMEFYAKKLGIKNGKHGRLSKQGDDDIIGGLLDGLDLDFLSEEENSNTGHSSASELHKFDSGTDSEEFKSESEGERENPYVAPTRGNQSSVGTNDIKGRYVPPALREEISKEEVEASEEVLSLRKNIKSSLNKLSESNLGAIIRSINDLYLTNARQTVNENFVTLVLDSVLGQERILDTFLYLHGALITAVYRLQGMDFGAYFIQILVEKFDSLYLLESKRREVSNIVSLLSSVYSLGLVSAKLIFDIVRVLLSDLNESNAEILLKLVRSSGSQMRSDSPSSLKEIVLLVSEATNEIEDYENKPRIQFLFESIISLKNNRLKLSNASSQRLIQNLKKTLGGIGNALDTIQVGLDDIRNIETRGKWWLVGSAWRDEEDHPKTYGEDISSEVNRLLDDTEPNWLELARLQKMNSDIRRAIFISIMSATDYVDALTKLDKLALKRSQEREIARVLLRCVGLEPAWNPYYGVLAKKLCDSHANRKTFQFLLWDLMKEYQGIQDDAENNEDSTFIFDQDLDENLKMKQILNLGRFFGFLMAEGALPLHLFKNIEFLTASGDLKLFLEVLFITFIEQIAKTSTKYAIGTGLRKSSSGMSGHSFDEKNLIERLAKATDYPVLLKGIQHFLNHQVLKSGFIDSKRQREKIQWGINATNDIISEIIKD